MSIARATSVKLSVLSVICAKIRDQETVCQGNKAQSVSDQCQDREQNTCESTDHRCIKNCF